MDWKHGYFAESGYTYGFYPETTPTRMAWLAQIRGVRAPLKGFRYLDLGCGQGLSMLLMACAHPDSEFVGIDFMPEHIAHARFLAKCAGLQNVTFIEGDFLELAKDPRQLGDFDYAVAHGITTWISPDVREALFQLAGSVIKPGGLMYNSYNTFPGWLPAAPFQHLVLQLQTRYNGQKALELAQQTMSNLKEAGSALFALVPNLSGRLDAMKGQDPAYLVQEYNNQFWQPVYCSQMLKLARSHKLSFMGSATIPEVFDGCYPSKLLEQINSESDPLLRETIRDVALGQSFRRDIYVKGTLPLWAGEKLNEIIHQRYVATNLTPIPKDGEQFEFKGGTLNLTGNRDAYLKLLELFGAEGSTVAEVQPKLPGQTTPALMQMIGLLVHSGFLAVDNGTKPTAATLLNKSMGKMAMDGAPYKYAAMGRLGLAISVADVELMLLGLIDEVPADQLALRLHEAMAKLGRHFLKDSKPITEESQAKAACAAFSQKFVAEKLPNFKRLGVL